MWMHQKRRKGVIQRKLFFLGIWSCLIGLPNNTCKFSHILRQNFAIEIIFKETFWSEYIHQCSSDNCVKILNFDTLINLVVKTTMFPYRDNHKYTWNTFNGQTHSQFVHILIDMRRHCVYWMYFHSGERTVILITIRWLQKLGKIVSN
jgi:hypothetical protein